MMLRTHLVITLFFIIFFINLVENKIIFVSLALIATFLPDIDSRYSKLGQRKLARILQWFTKHRGFIHSFTLLFILTAIFVLFWPIGAFGFFLGYGLHLLSDSFTVEGTRPFYPSKIKAFGRLKTGKTSETTVLIIFLFLSVLMIFIKIFRY